METLTVGVISIAHLSEQDAKRCAEIEANPGLISPLTVASDPFSVWLMISPANAEEASKMGLPSVADVIWWAIEQPGKLDWLRLDQDGELQSNLGAYDW